MRKRLALTIALAVALCPASVLASDFMDAWITFIFADDNLLAGPEERSPGLGFSQVDDELFFENLESEKRGQETQAQLVLYKRSPAFFSHLDVEAALVIEMENWVNDETGDNETRIGDNGSYLRTNYYFSPTDLAGDNLSLTAFPLDSQRFMLGYAYDIAWGGEEIFPGNSGQVPGARAMAEWGQGTGHAGYAFFGAKTARLLNEDIHELQTYYGLLGGAGSAIGPLFMAELNGGWFQRGAFPPQGEDSEIGGMTAEAYGASARLTLHQGEPVGQSIDFRLYRNDPEVARQFAVAAQPHSGLAWSSSLEATYLTQTLLDWDETDTTVLQPALAGNLNARVQIDNLRLHGDLIYRDLSFILFEVPGLAPYRAFPDDADIRNEWFVAGGVDYFFERPHLTPGIILGYKQPATFTSNDSVTVFRDTDDWETLPLGESAYDILSAKGTLKWDLAEMFTVVGEARYTLDNNRTKYEHGEDEAGRERVFEDESVTNRLGFALLLQARF